MNDWAGCADRLGALDKPVLLITGDEDILTPPKNSAYLADHIPGAQLIVFERGGHGLMFQYPAQFAAAVINFLQ